MHIYALIWNQKCSDYKRMYTYVCKCSMVQIILIGIFKKKKCINVGNCIVFILFAIFFLMVYGFLFFSIYYFLLYFLFAIFSRCFLRLLIGEITELVMGLINRLFNCQVD